MLCTSATEYQGDPQRPVLLRQTSDHGALSFDHHQHRHVARSVGLHHFQFGLAGLEETRHRRQTLARGIETVGGRAAERSHQRIVLGVLDPLEVAGHVTAYERRVGFGVELDEVGNLLVGNTHVSSLLK
jgi:hypothetical protein